MIKSFKKFIANLPVSDKFKKDVYWNVGSLIILSMVGVSLTVLIAHFYGAKILGIFNQTYAIYTISSQFAAGSIHLSCQRHIAEFPHNKKRCAQIISAGLIATLMTASVIVVLIFFLRNIFGNLLKSPDVSVSLIYILPGLLFFAVNKTLIAILNGFRLMKDYAIAQSLRYLLIITLLITAIILQVAGDKISFIFSGAEIILFFYLILRYQKLLRLTWKFDNWFRRHLIFGYKSLLGNVLVDVNTRVDVLILGYFTTDQTVGIYSFASMLAEGFYQLIVALKVNINPILANIFSHHKISELKKTILTGIRLTYSVTAVLGILGILLYPLFVRLLVPGQDFMLSWHVFIILMVGIILCSGYLPFQMLFVQTGLPLYYTYLITITFVSNVILNLILVPRIGMNGSALATSLAILISVLFLKIFTWKKLEFKI